VGSDIRNLARQTWLRVILVIPIVLAVHTFDWNVWRAAVANILMLCLHILGVASARVTSDTLASAGRFFRVETSCTFIDALLASVPLLWEWGDSAIKNLTFLSIYMAAWSILNIVRVAFGFVLLAHGVPWWLGHQVISGLFYFAFFCWIARRRNWALMFSRHEPAISQAHNHGIRNEATGAF
jgi:hypothetical protein